MFFSSLKKQLCTKWDMPKVSYIIVKFVIWIDVCVYLIVPLYIILFKNGYCVHYEQP